MTRRRSRRASRRDRRWVVLVVLFAVALTAVPAVSYTTGTVPRGGGIGVVDDPSGVVGLDVANGVKKNTVEPLVNVTSGFDDPVEVTVTLRDGTRGDLYYDADGDGATENVGDSVTLTVAPTDPPKTVSVKASGSPNTQLSFDVTASGDGVSASLPGRQTTIEPPGGGGGGPCANPNPPPWC